MTKNAPSEAVTLAPTPADTGTTPAVITPVTASTPSGQKSPALDHPPEWLGTRSITISPDGAEYAFLGNNGLIYQGFTLAATATARAFGFAFGAKQKADSDGAKDKSATDETALRLIAPQAGILAWCPPRTSGPREETATPISLQVKALLIAKLKTGGLGAAVKAKGIKLTGFTGGTDSLFTRYAAVVKEATGMEATEAQWTGFTTRTLAEATAAIAAIAEDPFA
jgi:hypothetical protein